MFDKFKLFFDDVNNENPISIICIQETWGHEDIHMDYFSLHNYTTCIVNTNRRNDARRAYHIYSQ